MERKRREAEGEREVGGEEGGGWILLGGQEDEKDISLCFMHELWVVVGSLEGGCFLLLCLPCSMVVWRLDMGFFFSFGFPFSLFAFPSLSIGALCFVMNGQCGMFPSWFPLLFLTNLQVL